MTDFWSSDLFLDPEGSDLKVHVETQRNNWKLVIPVHGCILKSVSKVFKTVLEGDKYMNGLTKKLEVKIPGDEEDAINFFRYLYTKKLGNLDVRSYIVLTQMAHMYEVTSLIGVCQKRIMNIVTPITVCRVYWELHEFASHRFRLFCKDLMLKSAYLIFMDNHHILLKEEAIRFLLESDDLNLLDEEQALGALWNWGRSYCLLENQGLEEFNATLKELLQLIRWSEITDEVDAPWYHLVMERESVIGQNVTNPRNNHKISLEQISKTLGVVNFEDPKSPGSRTSLVDDPWYHLVKEQESVFGQNLTSPRTNHEISLEQDSRNLGVVNFEDPKSFLHLRTRRAKQDVWALDSLLNPEHGDVEVHVKLLSNNKKLKFPVHGLVLKRASKVFRTMLEEDKFKESKTKEVEISIPGDEEDAFNFFRYLYTRDLRELDIRSYITLLELADMYRVRSLVELCEQRIKDTVTPISVCRVYWSLEKIASEEILKLCKDIMLKFAFLIFTENFHVMLSKKTMRFLLESDELNVLDEDQALHALWVWARESSVLKTASSKETTEEKFISLLDTIRWPMIKKIDGEAPWFQLLEKNNNPEVALLSCREGSDEVSLKQFSNVLRFSNCVGFKELKNTGDGIGMVDIELSCDVLLTGVAVRVNNVYNRTLSLKKAFVNNSAVTKKNILTSVTEYRHHCRELTFEFTPPVLLSNLHSNQIRLSFDGFSFYIPKFEVKSSVQSTIADSGRVIDFVVSGSLIGVHELYYIEIK